MELDQIVKVSDVDDYGQGLGDIPRLFKVVRPPYPEGLEPVQKVLLRQALSKKGKVNEVTVVESSQSDLEPELLKAAKRWHFAPRNKGNKWTENTVIAEVVYAYNEQVLITDLQYIDEEE